MVGKRSVILPGERYERHWTSTTAHVLVDYLEHWKWVIGTMIAVIGLASRSCIENNPPALPGRLSPR
ncbi:hypothetical protein LB553_05100 [Mesorhizobium sp. CA8]|uniref:hypothetical protein n=1 Tax=unclassified Mesorhizobium TaxID=325217 RepID=UPI001CCD2CDA|nr:MULTISPECIES: hypothetical protein [unclassified Mesorhizobium]MBZ9760253.1 hypothetical protein [Mesorhizobium sp. CA8]MBZ9817882.1 hypothetical protein [Mesorhizobium sp. CA4]